MIFNTLDEPYLELDNKIHEGNLEIFIGIVKGDKLRNENFEKAKSDLHPETYKPMTEVDQELINELWKDSIHRIP